MLRRFSLALATSFALVSFASIASATHSWGPPYHWARTANPFTLKLGDNVSSAWDFHLATASTDWSESSVLDTVVVSGSGGKNCRATAGQVQVCNRKYGATGWLGLAQIWITGGEHITQGLVKLNDTYFNTSTYNTVGWRSLVLCQEVGHNFGLDHQDENFNNDPIVPHTCMDYFVPGTSEIVHPNQHDYDQLELIYAHLDSGTTVGSSAPTGPGNGRADLPEQAEWGKVVRSDGNGRPSLFEHDLGDGNKIFTFVFWAESEGE